MKKTTFLFLLLTFTAANLSAQSVAQKRAAEMKTGMNLTYLDNWWRGTKEKKYNDFANAKDAAEREQMFADIAKNGFQTVRIPINFGAWASCGKPYQWTNTAGLKFADDFVKWAAKNNLNAIIDLHHVEFDGKVSGAATTERIVWLWKEIAERYKNTDAEKVFFELRNEPHDIEAKAWREQASAIIRAIRPIVPNHTLIVGFHDWNSRSALIESKPFADPNIIYSFHYYDPFLFTHQGANWTGDGLPDLKYVPFPDNKKQKIETPASAKGKWVEGLINAYEKDSNAEKMFADLKAAKDWSVKNNVPIFLGEFGSYSKLPTLEDRCRHAAIIYSALGKLDIPNAWWEWNDSFNMFEKGTTKIAPCMRKAIDSYKAK